MARKRIMIGRAADDSAYGYIVTVGNKRIKFGGSDGLARAERKADHERDKSEEWMRERRRRSIKNNRRG